MNKPLEKAIYKYLKEYKKLIKKNKQKINEKKMCKFISNRLTTLN